MNQKEIQLLYSYILNNRFYYEEQIQQFQCNLRFRKVTLQDCIELASLIDRYETFLQVTNDILIILKLKNS